MAPGTQAAKVTILWSSLGHQFFISGDLKVMVVHLTSFLAPKSECLLDMFGFQFRSFCLKNFQSSLLEALFIAPVQQRSSFRCLTKTGTSAVWADALFKHSNKISQAINRAAQSAQHSSILLVTDILSAHIRSLASASPALMFTLQSTECFSSVKIL